MNIAPPLVENTLSTRYSLLSRLQDWDDQTSWKEFFDIYWRLIYATAMKSGLADAEAQDVVQETIISVAKDIHKFERDRARGSFKGWLKNLTRWRIADQLKRRAPAGAGSLLNNSGSGPCEAQALEEIPDPAGDVLEAVWEEEWRTNLFQAAVERIKGRVREEYFQAFDLYVMKQWPAAKVARTVRMSIGMVYLAKHRLSALIRNEMAMLEERQR